MLTSLQPMHLKLPQKKVIKKKQKQKQLLIWLVTKSPIKIQKKSSQNNSETDSQMDKKSIVVPEDNELRLI